MSNNSEKNPIEFLFKLINDTRQTVNYRKFNNDFIHAKIKEINNSWDLIENSSFEEDLFLIFQTEELYSFEILYYSKSSKYNKTFLQYFETCEKKFWEGWESKMFESISATKIFSKLFIFFISDFLIVKTFQNFNYYNFPNDFFYLI